MHIQTIFPQIGVKISKPMLIRGNVATCAAIHRCEALGTHACDTGKQHLYWYSQVLCIVNSITQLITIPVILQNKTFLLVIKTTSIPCMLHTL